MKHLIFTLTALTLSIAAYSMPNDTIFLALEEKYPTILGTKNYDCLACHKKDKWQRNEYGMDLQVAMRDSLGDTLVDASEYTKEMIINGLTKIEHLDSDLDGYTNLEEFEAGTHPGDATDHPKD